MAFSCPFQKPTCLLSWVSFQTARTPPPRARQRALEHLVANTTRLSIISAVVFEMTFPARTPPPWARQRALQQLVANTTRVSIISAVVVVETTFPLLILCVSTMTLSIMFGAANVSPIVPKTQFVLVLYPARFV